MIDGWSFDDNLGLRFHGRTFVLVASRELVMSEFHHSRLAVYPGGTKMYHDLRRQYWWSGMKCDVASFVAHCLTFQQVKAEHRRPAGAAFSCCRVEVGAYDDGLSFWVTEVTSWSRRHLGDSR